MHAVAINRALLTTICLAINVAVQAAPPPITIAIAVTSERSQLEGRDASSHFHVVLQNVSKVPQRVWEEWNSWGYYSLSFELTDAAGKHWVVVKRKDMVWTRNFPSFETIEPGNMLVVDVQFGDKSTWEGFPLQKGQQTKVDIRAIYEVRESPQSKEHKVWVGRTESKPVEVTFARW